MTPKEAQAQSRGYLLIGKESDFINISFQKKIELLHSKIPIERTLGARLLIHSKSIETTHYLINALKSEGKLYSKIEICNTLSLFQELAIEPLIKCLGKIGNNQHKAIPDKEFKKDSYPLPRDIASRTIIRIGVKAIPSLINHLKTDDKELLSELIDTIGYIKFYNSVENILEHLLSCYFSNQQNDLIKWKIIRAMSGIFESESFLKREYLKSKNNILKREIERSLRLIEKRTKE
ncbi:MAG: hypothetical protein ACPG19_04740 [Saprospiraceae bacterium]